MADNRIGMVVGIDGEAEFRKQIQAIVENTKTLGSEMKLVTEQFARNADSEEALTAKTKILTDLIDDQKKKLQLQKDMLSKVAAEFGETDKRTLDWKRTVNQAQTEVYKLENTLADVNDALKDTGDSFEGTEFRKQIQDIAEQIKTLGSEMDTVTAQFARNADSEEALTAKTKVLTDLIEEQKKKLQLQKDMLSKVAAEYGETDQRTQEWKQTVNKTQTEIYKLENKLADTNDALKDTGDAFEDAEESAISFGDVLKANVLSDLIVDGIRELGRALSDFAKDSILTGQTFDSSMSNVAATMGVPVDAVDQLREKALEMGSVTAFTASEAADALNYMALAGYDAETSMKMLPTVLNLAAAGGMELATASDMITDTQTALGLSLEETETLVDQMAKAESSSNTSVEQLGEAMLTVGGTAKYMKGGTEQIATVLGVLADNSIKGEEGGTHLRNILLSLSDPTEDAASTLKDLGVEIFDAEGSMRDFAQIFPELNSAMSGLTDEEKLGALSKIFNTRDIAAATALMGTSVQRWNELDSAIEESAGAAQQMADTKLDNLAGDMTLFNSALDGAKIQISDALSPTLREFVQSATDWITDLTESGAFTEWIDRIAKAFSDLAPVIAGVSVAVGGFAIALNVGKTIDSVKKSMVGLNAAMKANPIGLVVSLLAGLATALITAYNTNEDFRNAVNEAWISVKETISNTVQNIKTFFTETIPNATQDLVANVKDTVKDLASKIKDEIGSLPEKIFNIGKDIVTELWKGIKEKFNWIKEQASSFASGVLNALTGGLIGQSQNKSTGRQVSKNSAQRDSENMATARSVETGFIEEMGSAQRLFSNSANALSVNAVSAISNGLAAMKLSGVGFVEEMGAVQRRINNSMDALASNMIFESAGTPAPAMPSATGYSELSPEGLADAIREALNGAAVYMDGQKVGDLVTTRQRNAVRARGGAMALA